MTWPIRRGIVVVVIATLAGTVLAAGLTIDEVLTLKQAGFSEAEIRAEVEAQGGPAPLGAEDVARLQAAGFSEAMIAYLGGGGDSPRDALTGILKRVRAGDGLLEILATIRQAGPDLTVDEATLTALRRERAHPAILLALAGTPLGLGDVRALVESGIPAPGWPLLMTICGVRQVSIAPAVALELAQRGVPSEVLMALKRGRRGMRRSDSGVVTVLAEETRLATAGRYEHPLKLFELRFPESWRLIRALQNGEITWTVTPEEDVLDPQQIGVYAQFLVMPITEQSVLRGRDAAGILAYLIPGMSEAEPGLELTGEVRTTTLNSANHQAAWIRAEGKVAGRSGTFTTESWVIRVDDVVILASLLAPSAEFPARRGELLSVLQSSRFGVPLPARRPTSFEPRHITERYLGSVVSVETDTMLGSGFIISADGYVLTNHHVVTNPKTGELNPNPRVAFDESLHRPRQRAELVARIRMPRYGFETWGTDLALLKIPPGDYDPIPLTPLAATRPGDGVVTLGFPARNVLTGVSVSVTTGVLTRYNRLLNGQVDSLYVDAAIERGSSGGPCISLVTGGVIGLTTFSMDPTYARKIGLENLTDYYGVAPIDQVLLHFPLLTVAGIDPSGESLDFLDTYGLARLLSSRGSHSAAVRLAQRAAGLRPDLPDALAQVGESLLAAVRFKNRAAPAGAVREFPKVAAAFERALAVDPTHERSLVAAALVNAEMGKFATAMRYADTAIRAHPKGWQGPLIGAQIELAQGRNAAAEKLARMAEERVGQVLPEPHLLLGRIHYAMGNYEEGAKNYRRAVELNPQSLDARLGTAEYYDLAGQPDQAIAAYRRLLGSFPGNPEVLTRITLVNFKQKRWGEVLRVGTEARNAAATAQVLPGADLLLMMSEAGYHQDNDRYIFDPLTTFLMLYPKHPRAQEQHLLMYSSHLKAKQLGMASAHMRFAERLGDTPKLQKSRKDFKPAPMGLKEIKNSRRVGYQDALLADLIRSGPLDFQVKTRKEIDEMLKKEELPVVIVQALVDACALHGVQKPADNPEKPRNGAGAGGRKPPDRPPEPPPGNPPQKPPEKRPPTTLVGEWYATGADPGGKRISLRMTLRADKSFHCWFDLEGQGVSEFEGAYLGDGKVLRLLTTDGKQFYYDYALAADTLTISSKDVGFRLALKRQ